MRKGDELWLMEYNGKCGKLQRKSKPKKIFKGGLREYWLNCGCIIVCDRCVFVL
jgi:hypothetical protein